MKKMISVLSLVALTAAVVPAFAQDTDPTPPPPADCKGLKGKERAACEKAKNKPPKK